MPNNLISSPPNLPAYLRDTYELKPIFGTPSDDEVMGIHAVIQIAQKAVDVPGTGGPLLLAKLAEHLFNVQMAKYRIKYLTATFPENTTYTPPTLPTQLTVQLEPVVDAPSEEDIVSVQNAIRTYSQLVNSESEILQELNRINSLRGGFYSVSSMFDPRINMELSQHLFDIQMAKYTQRARQSHAALVSTTIPNLSATIAVEQTSNEAQEEPTTNNSGTGANNTFTSSQSVQTGCIFCWSRSVGFESENTFPVNLTSVTASGSNSTAHDSYPQVGIPGTYYTNTRSSNATIPETYQHSPSVSQSVQLAETVLMSVPPELNTRRLIDTFVHRYTSKLPKSVREVCCSLCCGPDSVKLWEAKPTNLARHIMAHNGVKWFQCPYPNCPCGAPRFTTKDQGKRHLEKYHVGMVVTALQLIELDPDLVFQVQGSRRT